MLVAGLKLGMFAAIGGGVMGYATGKLFAEHEEKEAVFNELPKETGTKQSRTNKVLKRIEEYEKFEENCNSIKKLKKKKQSKRSKDILSIHKNLKESPGLQRHQKHDPLFPEVPGDSNMKAVLTKATSLPSLSELDPDAPSPKIKRRSKSLDT